VYGEIRTTFDGVPSRVSPPDPEHHEKCFTSYMPLLERAMVPDARVIEVGSGLESTKFFLEYPVRTLLSIESDRTWWDRVWEEHRDLPCRWSIIYTNGMPEYAFIPEWGQFDIGLVDGSTEGRAHSVEDLMEMGVSSIVVHDWEAQEHYGFDKMKVPSGYRLTEVNCSQAAHAALFEVV